MEHETLGRAEQEAIEGGDIEKKEPGVLALLAQKLESMTTRELSQSCGHAVIEEFDAVREAVHNAAVEIDYLATFETLSEADVNTALVTAFLAAYEASAGAMHTTEVVMRHLHGNVLCADDLHFTFEAQGMSLIDIQSLQNEEEKLLLKKQQVGNAMNQMQAQCLSEVMRDVGDNVEVSSVQIFKTLECIVDTGFAEVFRICDWIDSHSACALD